VELRHYWSIIWRRIWIIALIVGIIAIYAGYQYYKLRQPEGGLKAYQSIVTIQIGLQAPNNSVITTSNATSNNISYYASTSEALADEFASDQVIKSSTFDRQVIQQIQADLQQDPQRYGANADLGSWQDPTAIGAAITTLRSHNLVDVTVNWSTAAGTRAIATAIGEVAAAHIGSYLDYEVGNASSQANNAAQPLVTARIFSQPSTPALVAGPNANKPALLLALLVVGLLIGIALAFLVEYLDDRIRSTQEALQLLQLPSYGEVPRAPVPGHRVSQAAQK
jgi:capsular polysaccharide biosynthesis protein